MARAKAQSSNSELALYLVKIGRAFEINNIQGDHVTCDMVETQLSRSFGEGQPSAFALTTALLIFQVFVTDYLAFLP
jgi:hypothetical protein